MRNFLTCSDPEQTFQILFRIETKAKSHLFEIVPVQFIHFSYIIMVKFVVDIFL